MLERETAIVELWKRLAGVTGVLYTARNPVIPPKVEQMPCIQFFELGDTVEKMSMRGGYPIYGRVLTVVVEPFVNATAEGASTKEMIEFVKLVKKAVYTGGPTLGGKCSEIHEVDASRVLRPDVGAPVSGIGLAFEIRYNEEISKLFL